MFYATGPRGRSLREPQAGFGGGCWLGGTRRDPSRLFQRKTFDIVMMTGECEARRLHCACALESAWPISQYSWENLGKKQTN